MDSNHITSEELHNMLCGFFLSDDQVLKISEVAPAYIIDGEKYWNKTKIERCILTMKLGQILSTTVYSLTGYNYPVTEFEVIETVGGVFVNKSLINTPEAGLLLFRILRYGWIQSVNKTLNQGYLITNGGLGEWKVCSDEAVKDFFL